jgi:hypothetical protein
MVQEVTGNANNVSIIHTSPLTQITPIGALVLMEFLAA